MTFRSEKLRRSVAELACVNCGLEGSTQAAHSNLLEFGKGRGLKASDAAIMALCFRCHSELDQGKSMSKVDRRHFQFEAISKTLTQLIERGELVLK